MCRWGCLNSRSLFQLIATRKRRPSLYRVGQSCYAVEITILLRWDAILDRSIGLTRELLFTKIHLKYLSWFEAIDLSVSFLTDLTIKTSSYLTPHYSAMQYIPFMVFLSIKPIIKYSTVICFLQVFIVKQL